MYKSIYRNIRNTGVVFVILSVLLVSACGSSASDLPAEPDYSTAVKEDSGGVPEGGAPEQETDKAEETEEVGEEEMTEVMEEEYGEESDLPPENPAGIAAPSTAGALHVEGIQLVGENGEPVQLRGISTHRFSKFADYVNEECFAGLHSEWQMNVIRLAMYTAEEGGYCTGGDQEAIKNLIRDGVRYATAQDMYVIIDWHILYDNNPNIYIEEAKAFFAEMSAEFADADNVLYEICNEPNSGTGWNDVKTYAEQVIGVIRANDADAVILVGTPNWSQDVDKAAADPIDADNLMYTLHFYAASHRGELRQKMVNAVQAGLPVFVSEYGICDASGNGAIDETEADLWVAAMDEYGISYVAWNLSNMNESSAILSSSCTKISGFTESDLSASGRWLYGTLTGERNSGEDGQ